MQPVINSGKKPLHYRLDRLYIPKRRFILSKQYKFCYASVSKVGSTTMKYWMADLEDIGRDIEELARKRPDVRNGIHALYYLVAPDLVLMSLKQVRDIFAKDEYYRFALVRNPYTRLFSTWSDKVLKGLHEEIRVKLRNWDGYHTPPTNIEEVRAGFEGFVSHLHDVPGMSHRDRHWIPQASLLRPDILRYNCIAKLEDPGKLQKELAQMLGPAYKDPLQMNTAKHVSILSYNPEFITPKAKKLIQSLYAEDFELFQYDPAVLPAGKSPCVPDFLEKQLVRHLKKRTSRLSRKLASMEAETRAWQDVRNRIFSSLFRTCRRFLKQLSK